MNLADPRIGRAAFGAALVTALTGCGALTPANVATVEQVIAKIQAVMPYVSGIVSVIGVVVPGVTSAVNLVEEGLTTASNVFATLTSTMTVAAAQPLVGQIATSISGALTAAKQVIAALPANTQTAANSLLAEADTVLLDIQAFAAPVAVSAEMKMPTGALFVPTTPVHVFVRPVS
jgi:hypothetical protein